MRVVLHAFHFAEYAARLAMGLAESHEMLLVLNRKNADAELTEALMSSVRSRVRVVTVESPRTRNPEWLARAFRLRREILLFKPDVIHVQESLDNVAYWSVRLLRDKIPLVLTVHDHIPHSGDSVGWLGAYYIKDTRRQCDAVVVHGKCVAKEYAELAEGAGKLIFQIPHGVLGANRTSDEPGQRRAASEDTVARNSILFFGRIESYKGLGVLLEACDILRSSGAQFELTVAGRGKDLPNHLASIKKRPWVKLIDRFVPAEEVSKLFRAARLVVLPYTDATQSGVATIAYAHGVPVVASAVGGIPEVVIDGQTGLLVPPKDALALSRAIAQVLTDEQKAQEMGEKAAEFARLNLSWTNIASATTKVYETVTHQLRPC